MVLAMENEQDWTALGRAVVRDRVRAGHKTTKSLADKMGLSARIVGDIENGRRASYSPSTLTALEQALGWFEDSVRDVLAGGRATFVHDPEVDAVADGIAEADRRARGRWNELGPDAAAREGVRLFAEGQAALGFAEHAAQLGVDADIVRMIARGTLNALLDSGVLGLFLQARNDDALAFVTRASDIVQMSSRSADPDRDKPLLLDLVTDAPPDITDQRQESDHRGRESAAKSEAEETSAQDAANDMAARERAESTDSEAPARETHPRTQPRVSRSTGTPHGGGTAASTTP